MCGNYQRRFVAVCHEVATVLGVTQQGPVSFCRRLLFSSLRVHAKAHIMSEPVDGNIFAMYTTLSLEQNSIFRLMLTRRDLPAGPGQGAVAGASDVVAL